MSADMNAWRSDAEDRAAEQSQRRGGARAALLMAADDLLRAERWLTQAQHPEADAISETLAVVLRVARVLDRPRS